MADKRTGERIEGPTPSGGAYAIMYRDGTEMEIVEFDEQDKAINRTYGTTRPLEDTADNAT